MENKIGSKKKIFWGLGVLLVLLVIIVIRFVVTSSDLNSRRQGVALVKIQKPFHENVQSILSYTGDALPIQQAAIYAKVAGNLDRNYVEMGTFVHSGTLLALIDTTELYQIYQQTGATHDNTLLLFERTKQLFDKSLASQQDVDNAKAAMKVAKANFDAAATHLSYAHIIAPFDGFVTARFLDAGALVTASTTTLFTMMNLDSVKIIVSIPEKDLQQMYRVQTASIMFDALPGQKFTGHVSRFSQAVDLSTRTMAIEVDIPNRSRVIKPGMFATIVFAVDQKTNAVTVPSNALLKDDSGYYVFAVEESKAHKIPVKTGVEQNAHTEILAGLTGEETIITIGQQFVKDGSAVSIQK
jgi:membrane fusion protein (multidrug efflux system)